MSIFIVFGVLITAIAGLAYSIGGPLQAQADYTEELKQRYHERNVNRAEMNGMTLEEWYAYCDKRTKERNG